MAEGNGGRSERRRARGRAWSAEAAAARQRRRERRRASRPQRSDQERELLQRRIAAVVIVVVVVIAVMALTDAAPLFDDVSEEERVQDAVERFFAAYEEGDYEAVCGLLGPEVRQTIEAAGATETKQGETTDCPAIVEAAVSALPEEDARFGVKVESVRVSGRRAVATVRAKSRQVPETVELELAGDQWLVARSVITD